jgi:hypothetical protein
MRLNIAIPEEHVKKNILDAGLETTTRVNEELLKAGDAPHFREAAHRVRWAPEPPGAEHFDHSAKVLRRGWGDCDDLAPWHAASLRVTGEDKGAIAEVVRKSPTRWHAIVRRSDGTIEDPSIEAGMRSNGGARGATLPSMSALSGIDGDVHYQTPLIAVRPVLSVDGEELYWETRTDLPWAHSDEDFDETPALVALRRSGVANQSITGSLNGALWVGEVSGLIHPMVLDRAEAIRDAFDGWELADLIREYGEDEARAVQHVVGDIWGTIADVASKVISFVPGIGPMASLAIDLGKKGVEAVVSASKRPDPPPPEVIKDAKRYAKHREAGGAKPKRIKLHPPKAPSVVRNDNMMNFAFPMKAGERGKELRFSYRG